MNNLGPNCLINRCFYAVILVHCNVPTSCTVLLPKLNVLTTLIITKSIYLTESKF